ncbi:MAG: tRNA (N6-threonylcarbamoyladenosine(37)-N6)-methyltransferase TrmO [Deltaproteobacteria bacterium]|nr:MAG: tRNA (N6-threonylcarbamoyladenosine(37)-N6)-methyltransferase TrmO [Deltaproteobacteria bacterium]
MVKRKSGPPSGLLDLQAIGVIRSDHTEAAGTPIQPVYAGGETGQVIVDEPYAAALDDIEGFERLWLLYWMDRVQGFKPHVVPYRDTQEHGLFATRSPSRPNPIGLSVVRLLRREGRVLVVTDVDILDGTPLIDIKPYVSTFDAHPVSRAGWFDTCGTDRQRADDRFHGTAGHDEDGRHKAIAGCELRSDGDVVLRLQDVCVQTAAKGVRDELVARCLDGADADLSVAGSIELLGRFLETTDFRKLRSEHPELAGGTRCEVQLHRCEDGTVTWEICGSS